MKPLLRRTAITVLLLAMVPAAASLFAQKKNEDANSRSVQGSVSDTDGNTVTGAVVQLKNTKSLQIRSFITKEQGQYYFNSLSPDVDYELRAMYNGQASPTKTLSSFDGRKQAILNLKLDK
jgi:hypothetical protein